MHPPSAPAGVLDAHRARRRFLRHLAVAPAWPLGLALPGSAMTALTLAGCERAGNPAGPVDAGFTGLDLTGASYGRDFQLIDMHGQLRTLADFRGKVVMLYFGFVQCPDVCPTALARAQAVLEQLGPQDAARVQLIFVTVDPERDTPELLREYLGAFHPSFLALRGDADGTRRTADEFKVFYRKVPTGSSYTMDHTALTYLFDPQGRLRVAMRHEQGAADYAADVRALLGAA